MQNKQIIQHAVIAKNGVVQKVGKSTVYLPKTNYIGKGIKWFDDSRLIKKKNK